MRWDHQKSTPLPGTFIPKDAGLDALLQDPDVLSRFVAGGKGILTHALENNLITDSNLKNHYQDILEGNIRVARYPAVYARLYFCDTEEDIWDLVKDSLATVESFLCTYAGFTADGKTSHTASDARLERFCAYLESAIPNIRERNQFIRLSKSFLNPEDFSVRLQEMI